jgi:hypothetical protein
MIVSTKEIRKRRSKPVPDYTPRLTDQEVLEQARHRLQPHLPLRADGYVCTTAQLLHLLLGVAATRSTLEAVCAEVRTTACAATLRGYLNDQLQAADLPQLERALNVALAENLPPALRLRETDVAVDYHDQAYYGRTTQEEGLWVRAAAKAGTTRVYRVATAYVVVRGLRLTLALKFVRAEDEHSGVLRFLLKRLKALKIKARTLYLDRGFAGVRVIRFLQRAQQRAVIACPRRGKTGGVRALCVGRHSYLTTYTFANPTHGMARAQLAVCRAFTTAKRTGRKQKAAQWLVFILIHCMLRPKQVRQQYRRRFGIETSYRCARQLRGWTTARNVAYRFLLIGLSFFLLNVWIELRWVWTRRPRRGRRYLAEAHFRLRRFADFIAHAVRTLYGHVCHIEALSAVNAYG